MEATLTTEDLVNIKQTVLTLERQEIARNIDPKRFFSHLRAKYVLDERDCDEIRAVPSRVGSAELFVDTLKRKGGRGYDEFCNALMSDQTQMFILQRMTQTLELLRAKVLERKAKRTDQQYYCQPLPQMIHPQNVPQPGAVPTVYTGGISQIPTNNGRRNTMPEMNHIQNPSYLVPKHFHSQFNPQHPQRPQMNTHRPLRKVHSRQCDDVTEQIIRSDSYSHHYQYHPQITSSYALPPFPDHSQQQYPSHDAHEQQPIWPVNLVRPETNILSRGSDTNNIVRTNEPYGQTLTSIGSERIDGPCGQMLLARGSH